MALSVSVGIFYLHAEDEESERDSRGKDRRVQKILGNWYAEHNDRRGGEGG